MVRVIAQLLTAFCVIVLAMPAHATVNVRVDRSNVQITDSIRVVFETDQGASGDIDLSVLENDFEVLGTSQSTNVNIINGQFRRSSSWTVDLLAKREGTLTIPAVLIGNEFTEPVTVTVSPSKAGAAGTPAGDIFLEVEVDTTEPYVQGQVIYTVRLFRSVPISNASLTEPVITGGDVVIEQLGDDIAYETQRGGRTLAVIERRYALFPQSSGNFSIAPLRFEGRVTPDRRFGGLDPFGRGKIVRIRSDAIEFEARPIPAGFTGNAWLPAQQVFLVESWPDDSQEFRVGEPVTRTLTLRANGLSSSQLPEIAPAAPDNIKQYPDQPVLENRADQIGLIAIRQEKIALIPSEPGTFVLPEVVIPWWNTRSDALEYARLPARPIDVLPAVGAPAAEKPQIDTSVADGPVETVEPAASRTAKSSIWVWVSLALGIGWLATAALWLATRNRVAERPSRTTPPSEKSLVQKIRQCCADNHANAAKDALLAWGGCRWPGSRVSSLGDLAARLDGDLQIQIHVLSHALYDASESVWDGKSLWHAFETHAKRKTARPAKPEPELEPLYL
jgi:hypothetical protein